MTMVPNRVRTNLWDVLQDLMEQRGLLSHRELGLAAGVSNKTIDKIAHGHIPKASTLRVMEEALGLGRNELLIAADYLREPADITVKQFKLLTLIESLSSQAQEEAIQYAQYLIMRDHARKTGPEGGRQ